MGEVRVAGSTAFVPYLVPNGLIIVGLLINDTPNNVEFMRVNAVLRDENGMIVDGAYAYSMQDSLAAGYGGAPFKIMFNNPPPWSTYELTVTWNTTNRAPVRMVASEEAYFDSGSTWHARGYVQNHTDQPRSFVKVFAVLFDADGNPIGAEYQYITPTTLAPGQIVPFDIEVFFWAGKPDTSRVKFYYLAAYDD